MEFQKTFFIVTLSFTLWSALALLADNRGNREINRWFAGLIFMVAIPQVFFYTLLIDAPKATFYWGVLSQAVLWLKGPITLAMVRLTSGRHISMSYGLHALPFACALIDLGMGSPHFMLWVIGGAIHALIYLACGCYQLNQARGRLRTIAREYPNSAYYWLLWVLAGLAVMILTDLVLFGICWWRGAMDLELLKPLSWLMPAYLFSLAFCIVYRPELFFRKTAEPAPIALQEITPTPAGLRLKLIVNNPPIRDPLGKSTANSAKTEAKVLNDNYTSGGKPDENSSDLSRSGSQQLQNSTGNHVAISGGTNNSIAVNSLPAFAQSPSPKPPAKNWRELDESLAQALALCLVQLMDAQIYRQHELTLGDLAVRLGVSVHQTSELLNVFIGQSFYDYINRARLAYACQRLADPDCQQRIIDIAFEAGFSNKNSFYRYFREHYGQTPVEFRTQATQISLSSPR